MQTRNIAVLPGDGIGPEIMREAIKVLDKIGTRNDVRFNYTFADVGGAAIDNHGEPLPADTVRVCEQAEAVLFGSVGGPKWQNLPPDKQPERGALLPLRKIFNLYANLRPIKVFKSLAAASPLRPDIVGEGFDILIVRELTGGIYFGEKGREGDRAWDTQVYTVPEVERIAKVAFEAAARRRNNVTSIDKANVLTTMVLWREVMVAQGKKYPGVALSHMLVDNAAMQLVRDPKQFDVVVADNMFGDILSDEAAMISGSIGMLPSASLTDGTFGLYEPAGGSAPDIAGKGIANPLAQIMSAALMLRYSFGMDAAADAIVAAIERVLNKGYRTGDIMSPGMKRVGTAEIGDLVVAEL